MRFARTVLGLALLLCLAVTPIYAASAEERLLVDNEERGTAELLAQAGARKIEDYGGFSLWSTDASTARAVAGRNGIKAQPDYAKIPLRGGVVIDTNGAEPTVPADLRQTAHSGYQLWMVQFGGPIRDAWLAGLRQTGARIVTYMPHNAYVIWGNGETIARLEKLQLSVPALQWSGAYHPAYRIHGAVLDKARTLPGVTFVDTTVQVYATKQVDSTLARLRQLGGAVYKNPGRTMDFVNISLALPAGELVDIANWPDVFNVEPWGAPRRMDEVQDQILAGNITVVGGLVVPSAPGYLAWLASFGFNTTPQAGYPVVDIVDDGIDNGATGPTNPLHPDFRELGVGANPSRLSYISDCTTDPNGNGVGGHGNINAAIVGAYNNLAGAPHVDANGYRRDLGMSPYGRMGGTKIFRNSGPYDVSACGGTDQGVVGNSFTRGATMTSNSWGLSGGDYDASAQAYDAMTRDASAGTAGNQQMLHVFAAANDGPGAGTVASPGAAKNVVTVAATENVRDQGISDGCVTNGDNADDMIFFSSRGPTNDGRIKPDISGPGTHVNGAASQDPGYTGGSVCGQYYPAGQTLYAISSGTSHSTPAVAGAASLIYEYHNRVYTPGNPPSPAMIKATMVSSARWLDGVDTGDDLPSNSQGWGDLNLGRAFDSEVKNFTDQTIVLGTTGQIDTKAGNVASGAAPFRVTLVWTDVPGPTVGNNFVNNLDLEVVVGGSTYLGNVFTGPSSVTGGTADIRNNVESVFIPAGVTGNFTVRVIATNIAGDGVPGNADTTDQDFALIIYNGNVVPTAVVAGSSAAITAESCAPADNSPSPGETMSVNIGLANVGTLNTTNLVATLQATGGVTAPSGPQTYGALIAGGPAVVRPFTFTVGAGALCGSTLTATFNLQDGATNMGTASFDFIVGVPTPPTPATYTTGNIAVPIPDNGSVDVPIVVPDFGIVGDIDATVRLNHTWDADVVLTLISPSGTSITLAGGVGGTGDNFGSGANDCSGVPTEFDDEAATPIGGGAPPFAGSFQPQSPLSGLDGEDINGTWILRVADVEAFDTGTIGCVTLQIGVSQFACCGVAGTPALQNAGFDLTGESCAPPNTEADPGETVTVAFGIRNAGTGPTTNLVGTLLATGGVLSPSGPQTYGVVVTGGPDEFRPFNFTVDPATACGASITASVQFQDGATDLGTFTYTISTGVGGAATVSNPAIVTINDNTTATPYPATVAVSGIPVGFTSVTASLLGFSHTWPDDVDVLLVSPTGQKVVLISDAGGATDVAGINLTIDDAAAGPPTDGGPLTGGTYRPSDYAAVGETFPAPAPAPPYALTMATFVGNDPNGTWSLYVMDQFGGDTGSFAGGFSLNFNSPPVCCSGPTVTADLAITKSDVGSDPVAPGGNITYTITVTNNGPDAATNVTMTDLLPAGTSLVSATPSQGSCGAPAVTCNLLGLGNGNSATVIVVLTAPGAAGTVTNVASVASDQFDDNTADNSATETTTVSACITDSTAPVVTPPANITVDQTTCVGGAAGSTSATSANLGTFLGNATATDNCDLSPTELAPQIGGVDVTATTLFPVGTTTVTFRFQDDSSNTGTATATVTVILFYGDLDLNGVINAIDLVTMANHLVGNINPGTPPFNNVLASADVDRSGFVNASDLVLLANRLVGNIACLPTN